MAEEGQSCTCLRLDNLDKNTESTIDYASLQGIFSVKVLASDDAFSTTCELSPLGIVPTSVELLKSVPFGMYIVGRDIAAGPRKEEDRQVRLASGRDSTD